MYFDRYDICEAYWLLYCEWGEYAWSNKFHNVAFKPAPTLSYKNLTKNGKAIYAAKEAVLIEKYYTSKGLIYND